VSRDVGGRARKGSELTRKHAFAGRLLRGKQTARPQILDREPIVCSPYTPQYSLNKSIGLYMTTPSSETLEVLGVLVDPAFLCRQHVSLSEPVDKVVQSLWRSVNERVDGDFTSETLHPSLVSVLIGEIGPFTHFNVLTCYQSQIFWRK